MIRTKSNWMAYVQRNEKKLVGIVEKYHPSNLAKNENEPMLITAPAAEDACAVVRKQIAEEEDGDINVRFATALMTEDAVEINSILNSTWFGVPESTECWKIEGFKELVEVVENWNEEWEE